jgi:hypothetical protein
MRRLYLYILSAVGVGATLTGLSMVLGFVIDAALGRFIGQEVLRTRMTASLATLLAGLPLWALTWRPLQNEAAAAGDAGDHARRSLIRRVYLYLALFAAVVGGMITAAELFTTLLRTILGSRPGDFLKAVLDMVELLTLFAGLGTYHGLLIRKDGKMASRVLSDKHAAFPVMIIDKNDGPFSQTLMQTLQKHAPGLPVVFQQADKPFPTKAALKAVLMPFELAAEPPAPLRKWLAQYKGLRLAVPYRVEDVKIDLSGTWICTAGTGDLPEAVGLAVQMVRQAAEGQEIRQKTTRPGWMVAIYIMAGIFGLELLFAMVSLSVSLIER